MLQSLERHAHPIAVYGTYLLTSNMAQHARQQCHKAELETLLRAVPPRNMTLRQHSRLDNLESKVQYTMMKCKW